MRSCARGTAASDHVSALYLQARGGKDAGDKADDKAHEAKHNVNWFGQKVDDKAGKVSLRVCDLRLLWASSPVICEVVP